MKKELMEAFQKQAEQASQQAALQEEEMARKTAEQAQQARQCDDLMRNNQKLSETISNIEERNRALTQKVNSVKIY